MSIPAGLPKGTPSVFTERLIAAQDPDLSAGGEKLTPKEMDHALKGLEGAPENVQKDAALWLAANSVDKGEFVLAKGAEAPLLAFVNARSQGAPVATLSDAVALRMQSGAPQKLTPAMETRIKDAFLSAKEQDNITWDKNTTPPNAKEWMVPPTSITLDSGNGPRNFKVYLSRDGDQDLNSAKQAMLLDVSKGLCSSAFTLSETESKGVSDSIPNLEDKDEGLADSIASGYRLALKRREADWSPAPGKAKKDPDQWFGEDHFLPAYRMTVRSQDPNSHGFNPEYIEREVLVYFSKNSRMAFGRPKTTMEEAEQATLWDPKTNEMVKGIPLPKPQIGYPA